MMTSKDLKIDWLYHLKRKMLLSILCVLTASIVLTMIFIAFKLRDTLAEDSKVKTKELAVAIDSSLHHLMIQRSPEAIQDTLERIADENEAVTQIFILNKEGRITYSSNRAAVDTVLSRHEEEACRVCHSLSGSSPQTGGVVIGAAGQTLRNVSLIYNENDCHECHDPGQAINGKLIIDRSLSETFALITDVQLILLISGLVCLVILVPLFSKMLSRGINKYIVEIFTRNEELHLLYVMVERLSKTLDIELLKEIVIEIFRDILSADEVVLVLTRGEQGYSTSCWSRENGKVERKKIAADGPDARRLEAWAADELNRTEVSADGKELCMPIKKGSHRLALIIARRDEKPFDPIRLRLNSVVSSHIAVAFDNARLYYIAITDELTKVFTKRHFRLCIDEVFADYKKYGSKFSLLMMDLDRFKQVNDSHGHVVGDTVLRELGGILRESVRENDLVFRYGGEEFAVILSDTAAKGAKYVAERIRLSTEAFVFEEGTIDLKLTISIGIATCPAAPTIHDLIVDADRALYEAKNAGRNRAVLSSKNYSSD